MFDIGFGELLLLAVIALIVVGPDRLPEFARVVGVWVSRINRTMQTVRHDIARELHNENIKQQSSHKKEGD